MTRGAIAALACRGNGMAKKLSVVSETPSMRMVCPACNLTFEPSVYVCSACGTGLLEMPDTPLLTGQLLDGRYDIEGVVGTGGMGTVYRARQRGMERAVAIKVLHAHYAHQPRAVKRFFREAQAASRLVHPNVVTVYDLGVRRPDIFIWSWSCSRVGPSVI